MPPQSSTSFSYNRPRVDACVSPCCCINSAKYCINDALNYARIMSKLKRFTREEIQNRNSKQDAVFIINNEVYNVTSFLDDHPGGHEVLLNVAGKDASEDFDDVGHSTDAKEMMKKYIIGELVDEDKVELKKRHFNWEEHNKENANTSFVSSWKFPVLLGLLMTVLYTYLFG